MNRTIRTVPLLLLAAVLLVAGLAGGASAAKLITGKQIKNNSVTGQDLKNNTVTTKDIKNKSLTGADVKDGSIGPKDLSPQARTQVFFDDNSGVAIDLNTCPDTGLDSCDPLVSVPGAKGTFLVTMTGVIDTFAGPAPSITNRCGLVRGTHTLGEVRFALNGHALPGETQSFALQRLVTSTDTTPITVRCTEMGGEDLRVSGIQVSAVRVQKAG